LSTWGNLEEITNIIPEDEINILKILDVDANELLHSSFIAWLIDRRASHSQGNVFFKAFLDACEINLLPKSLDSYRVWKERAEMESIIDIMVFRKGSFLIYIENKISSPEGIDQCNREFRDMRRIGLRLNIRTEDQYAVFLTPEGRKPQTGDIANWNPVSYKALHKSINNILPNINHEKVKYYIEDWLDLISSF